MEKKEKLLKTGQALEAKCDTMEGKMKREQDIHSMYTDLYRSSLTATKREQDKFKDGIFRKYYDGDFIKSS